MTSLNHRHLSIALGFLWATAATASADQFGLFTYEIVGGTVEITDYPTSEVGEVEIPAAIDGKPVTSIGDGAFSRCSGLTSATIPTRVLSIGDYAFYGCSGLTGVTLPSSVTSIGRSAFSGCSGLTSVTIPTSVTSIGDYAFFGCSRLGSILLEVGNLHYASEDGVLFDAARTSIIRFPAGKTGDYTIPSGVTSIGDGAFSDCSGLTSVTIAPEVSRIGDFAFSGCSGLASVTIPSGVTSIGYSAFSGCSGLTSVAIPSGITSIDRFTFSGCSGLISITIGAGVAHIDVGAFRGCRALTSITVEEGNPNYASQDGVVFDAAMTVIISCPEGKLGDYTIPPGVTSIRHSAFSNCSGLTGITIGAGVTRISDSAFSDCSGLTGITIGAGVTSIGRSAFRNCSGLTSITIPSSVTDIGEGAFAHCSKLTTAILLSDTPPNVSRGSYGAYDAFYDTAPDFTIYYLSCSTGFTSPFWNGYATIRIDERACPAAPWLIAHGFTYDTDLDQDLNNDGVSLRMAYALDLDPNRNLRGSLPAPVLEGDHVGMSFHGISPGITYTVETSTDLENWTGAGVILSAPDLHGQVLATVGRDAPRRYLRLVVGE